MRSAVLVLVAVLWPPPAQARDAIPAVTGEGSASKAGVGQFSANLPDGSQCTANFSGGKISVFGHSAARTTASCRKGETVLSVRAVVYRRLNGSPREATLTFNDGSKIRILIPRAADAAAP